MKRNTWQVVSNVFCALFAAAVIAATPIELAIITVPLLLAWIIRTALQSPATAQFQVALVGAVIAGAYFAPLKYVNHVLGRPITLAKKTLTLAELKAQTGWAGGRRDLPTSIHWRVDKKLQSTVVTFPTEELTLREFVQTVEAQTHLRHRFAGGCANGSTILFGVPPSFLVFRDPEHPYEFSDDEDTREAAPLSQSSPAR